jgi:hypothetical protein
LRQRAHRIFKLHTGQIQSRCHECGGISDFNSKKGKPFTIARPAVTKCANGKSWLCAAAGRGKLRNKNRSL